MIGHQRLWVSVITQAMFDAMCSAKCKLLWRRMEILEARDWLLKPNKDFDMVCALAGLEPDRVRALAKPKIEGAIAKDGSYPEGSQNFREAVGTGVGSIAQKRAKIDFSQTQEAEACP